MQEFLLGSDPEFGLIDADGKFVSAIGVLPPQKDALVLSTGAKLYYDNALAEVALPPMASVDKFLACIRKTYQEIYKHISPLKLSNMAVMRFTPDQLSHPDARTFGCRPDLDAWDVRDGKPRAIPPPPSSHRNLIRTGGGHIHFGHPSLKNNYIQIVRMLDLVVGTFLVLIDQHQDAPLRNKGYGGCGRFRITPYGIEYRTPSNIWLTNPQIAEITLRMASLTCKLSFRPIPGDVKLAIDKHSPKLASEIVNNIHRHEGYIDSYILRSIRDYIETEKELGRSTIEKAWQLVEPKPPRDNEVKRPVYTRKIPYQVVSPDYSWKDEILKEMNKVSPPLDGYM